MKSTNRAGLRQGVTSQPYLYLFTIACGVIAAPLFVIAQSPPQSRWPGPAAASSSVPEISLESDEGARLDSQYAKSPSGCGDGSCDTKSGEHYGTCPRDCESLDDRADFFKGLAQSSFHSVDEGVFAVFNAEHCADVPVCFYNNPTSPYGRLLFRLAPGEPDPDPQNRRGSPQGMEDLYTGYRLRPDEALIWIGRTPPPCPYFSFTAYVFSRFNPEARGGPPYADRAVVFASLGDSENALTLKTGARPGESSFDQESVLIVTASGSVDRAVRRSLVIAGFPDSMINTLVLPCFKADGVTPKIFMGYENEADVFTILMRIASPEAQQSGTPIREWLDDTGARVFRVRAADSLAFDPLPMPALREHGNGTAEDAKSLEELVRSIRNAQGDQPTEERVASAFPPDLGDRCLDNLTQCNGDCRDTPYMAATFRLGPEPEAIIVAGRNHENSRKASYVNITATRVVRRTAYYSIVMAELQGSAEVYLPDHPDAPNLWQMKFARKCYDEPYCYELSEDQIPIGGAVAVLIRAYLDPSTGTSAKTFPSEESEIVFPRVLKINKAP